MKHNARWNINCVFFSSPSKNILHMIIRGRRFCKREAIYYTTLSGEKKCLYYSHKQPTLNNQ